MKTLNEIKNQTKKEALTILQQFVNKSVKEPYEVDERTLNWVYERAAEKADFATPDEIQDGYELYDLDIEYCNHNEGVNDYTQHITVSVAVYFNEETEEYHEYFAL